MSRQGRWTLRPVPAELEARYVADGWWTDAGTFDSLLQANNLVAEKAKKS